MEEPPGTPDSPQSPEPTQADPDRARRRAALLTIFLVVFIDLLGFGIVLPQLPLYAKQFLVPLLGEHREALQGVLLGLLMSCFSLMQFIFAPIWGRISDHVGRRPILLLGLVGSVVFYTLFGIALELGALKHVGIGLALLFISRLGAGIAGATISTANAVIADSTSPKDRSHGMALIGVAFGIGFTFGPLLGYVSSFVGLAGASGFLAAGLSALALIVGYTRLPETLRADTTGLRRQWLDLDGLTRSLRTPTIGTLIVAFFLATFSFGMLESTLALLNQSLFLPELFETVTSAADAQKLNDQRNFLIFAYVGFVLMLVQGGIYRPLARRVDEVKFLRVGIGIMTAGLLLASCIAWGASHGYLHRGTSILVWALPVLSVAVTGFAFVTPSVSSLISRRSDPARQGEILGVNQSASAMARILGPFIGLSLFHLEPTHVLPYTFSACLLGLVFFLTLRLR